MNLSVRVRNILSQPAQEWAVIERESARVSDLYGAYIVPLAAIGPVASIIGLSIIGLGGYRIPLMSSIGHAVVNSSWRLPVSTSWRLSSMRLRLISRERKTRCKH